MTVDALRRIPGVERILTSRLVEPVVATALRGRLTDRPLAFTLRELAGTRGVHRYRVRGSDVAFVIAHGSPDVLLIDEIFYQRLYEPPAPVAALLAARGGDLVALDLGANIGLFGAWLAARGPFARLDAFEPEPRNAALLGRTIALNGLDGRWVAHEAAAGPRDGSARFAAGDYATSHITTAAAPATIVVPVVDVLPLVAAADLVKLDVEGSEWDILADERFAAHPPAALVLEYHPERAPSPDTRRAVEALLDRAGLSSSWIFHAPSGVGMAWAWRDDAIAHSTSPSARR